MAATRKERRVQARTQDAEEACPCAAASYACSRHRVAVSHVSQAACRTCWTTGAAGCWYTWAGPCAPTMLQCARPFDASCVLSSSTMSPGMVVPPRCNQLRPLRQAWPQVVVTSSISAVTGFSFVYNALVLLQDAEATNHSGWPAHHLYVPSSLPASGCQVTPCLALSRASLRIDRPRPVAGLTISMGTGP